MITTTTDDVDRDTVPHDFTFTLDARFTFTIPAEDREAGFTFPSAEAQLDELRGIFDVDDVDGLTNLSALIGTMSAAGLRPTVEIGDLTGYVEEVSP